MESIRGVRHIADAAGPPSALRRNVTKIQAGLLRNERQEGGGHGGCRVREFLVLVEERHVGVVQELHFGTVADQGLGLFGQLIGYRHACLISTAMAVQCAHRLVLPAVYAHAHRLAAVYGHRELCARRHPIIVGKPVGHAGAWLFPEIGVSLSPVAREGNTCGHSLVGKAQPCQG